MTGAAEAKLLAAARAVRSLLRDVSPWIERLEIAGIGWATVELERAARELGEKVCAAWEPATGDPLLGARAWRCADAPLEGTPRLLLLEPETEGRLAASLARFGEGLAAIYLLERPGIPPPDVLVSAPLIGPLGPARLVLGAPAWGPHALLVGITSARGGRPPRDPSGRRRVADA
jgi:hypothetical protein